MARLALTYEFDPDDDFGWLGVAVETDRFSGRGGFWVQWQDVEEFGQTLRAYPIPNDAPLVAAWGYAMCEGDDLMVGVEVAAANRTGDLKVSVELADLRDPKERVRTSFATHYPQLEAFSDAIARLMQRQVGEAVLLAS